MNFKHSYLFRRISTLTCFWFIKKELFNLTMLNAYPWAWYYYIIFFTQTWKFPLFVSSVREKKKPKWIFMKTIPKMSYFRETVLNLSKKYQLESVM